jgi:putative membrane protein
LVLEKIRPATANQKQRTVLNYLILSAKGFCMGASDVVPGVSGGTMAFILGIYEELLLSIRSFDIYALKLLLTLKARAFIEYTRWKFLLAVVAGILTAVFSLARGLSWLLENKPVLIWSFFFGLIAGSVFIIIREIRKWDVSAGVCLLTGAAGAYILVALVPVATPNDPWFLFLSGAIAICAMILPGISGSFILALLGKYQYVLEAVNKMDFMTLFLIAAGACVGLVSFVRILSWLFLKRHDMTVALLTGLMLGSLRKIWPWKKTLEDITDIDGKLLPIVRVNVLPDGWNMEVTIAVCLIVAGLFTVLAMAFMAERKKNPDSLFAVKAPS